MSLPTHPNPRLNGKYGYQYTDNSNIQNKEKGARGLKVI